MCRTLSRTKENTCWQLVQHLTSAQGLSQLVTFRQASGVAHSSTIWSSCCKEPWIPTCCYPWKTIVNVAVVAQEMPRPQEKVAVIHNKYVQIQYTPCKKYSCVMSKVQTQMWPANIPEKKPKHSHRWQQFLSEKHGMSHLVGTLESISPNPGLAKATVITWDAVGKDDKQH